MKKDFGVKTWLYPMPVLMIATYDEDGSPNVMNAAKEKGLFRLEGKDYVMKDGDITNFRFNI